MPNAKDSAERLLTDLHQKLYQSDNLYEEAFYTQYQELVERFNQLHQFEASLDDPEKAYQALIDSGLEELSKAIKPLPNFELPLDLECGGSAKIFVRDGIDGTKKVSILYCPDSKPDDELIFGSRNLTGFGQDFAMTEDPEGVWRADIEMLPNESREFIVCLGRPVNGPPDFDSPRAVRSKVGLINGQLVTKLYPNPALEPARKGRIEQWIFKSDGSMERYDGDAELEDDEQLIDVYIPAGYSTAPSPLEVLVMLDGDMHLRQDPYGNSTDAVDVLDNLISRGEMAPSVVVFHTPTPPKGKPGPDQVTPRLKEYGCSEETAGTLARIPKALSEAGVNVKPIHASICGQSMGGLQALFTSHKHPNVFSNVIAQSPALWWRPPAIEPETEPVYRLDKTWRASLDAPYGTLKYTSDDEALRLELADSGYVGYIHELFGDSTELNVVLQAGTHETGTISPVTGAEPLTQATKQLSKQLDVPLFIHNGCHCSQPWSTGLVHALPAIMPGPAMKMQALKDRFIEAIEEYRKSSEETSQFNLS